MALGGGCCHTQLAALNVFERSGRLVGFFWALIFCGALVQLKQNTTKKHWAVKGSRWVGRWCSVLYSWARLGRKTKLSILNHSWVSPFSSLCCLCCSFRKIAHFYFLQEGDDPCCLLAANSLFLSCHFFFSFFIFSVRSELLVIPNAVLLALRDAVSGVVHDRFASQTNHCSFMSLWKHTDAL